MVGVGVRTVGEDLGVGEQVKCAALGWAACVMRVNEDDFVRRVYDSRIVSGHQ